MYFEITTKTVDIRYPNSSFAFELKTRDNSVKIPVNISWRDFNEF